MGNLIRSAFLVLLALMGLGSLPAAAQQYRWGYDEGQRRIYRPHDGWEHRRVRPPPPPPIIIVTPPPQQNWGNSWNGNGWVQPQPQFNLNLQVGPPRVPRAPDGLLGSAFLAQEPSSFCDSFGGTLFWQYRWYPGDQGYLVVSPACVVGQKVIAYRGTSGRWNWWPQPN